MRLRNARLRTKVTALLVSLIALWAFTAWVTVREGLNMLGVARLDAGIAQPSERLLVELQNERRLSLTFLGASGSARQQRDALNAQRKRTEDASANFKTLAGGSDVQLLGSAALDRRLKEMFQKLDGLQAGRKGVDAGTADRVKAADIFTDVIDSLYRVYDSMATLDDVAIAKDTRTTIQLSRARDILSLEDAIAAGGLAAGRMTETERALFAQTVGTRRFLFQEAVAELPAADRAACERLIASESFNRMRSMEEQLMRGAAPAPAEAVDARQWASASQPVLAKLQEMVLSAGDGIVERATPVAAGVIVRLSLAGGLGLLAVIASIILSITTARALVQQLDKLRVAAWELANERLPSVVDRIGHGQHVDIAAEAPPLEFGNDQIGHVGQAFNAVQRTAIKVAVEQAQLRRDIADILRNLARRTQSLVHRQLSVLDVMERRENDPQELRDLFRLDHLATRMRRYAENLLVLSGAAPGRAWRDSVPMIDVVRGALAEIEDYTRIDVLPLGGVALDGRAVGDVIHLVAELAENAASFSPPYTTVQVSGYAVAHGYALEIEDRGLGMSPEDLTSANERIANPPELKLSGNARLGLYVVSRLAERHEIRVTFKASPYGGTTVVVLLPQDLIREQAEPEPEPAVAVPQPRTVNAGALAAGASAGGFDRGSDPLGIAGPGPASRRERAIDEPGGVTPPERREMPRHAAGRGGPGASSGGPGGGGPAAPGIPGALSGGPAAPGIPGGRGDQDGPAPSLPPVLPPPDSSHTPGGLPRRVPQTHLAAPLQEDESTSREPGLDDADERSPETIRAAMASFQDGTRRGRSDAAQLLGKEGDRADGGGSRT
ncbi:nitrate- and nitrite sensing domain-containing protein [Streptosporangium sp. NPDC051023]|uniref:sensor histidine kinase n=1 Tax=Streptosporangium sp. NPDC051023 TaxID=3155410 RepID=UPI00344C7250